MSILKGVNGEYSSKRAMGILYLISLLVMYLYKEVKDLTIQNPEIFIGMVATGGGLLGIALFEYFSNKKSTVDPDPNTPPPPK